MIALVLGAVVVWVLVLWACSAIGTLARVWQGFKRTEDCVASGTPYRRGNGHDGYCVNCGHTPEAHGSRGCTGNTTCDCRRYV